MDDRSQIWHLKRGDELVADLVVVGADYPWLQAHVEPTPAYDEVKHLFAELETNDEAWAAATAQIRATLTLESPDGTPVAEYLLHIDGESAWWRWTEVTP
ncbi:hypothetical protein [Kribbella italica]|uniref:Uncharacterized protein n=1 Tax=Kribbella italica TaxID=1540520 RepID=A0A7W9JD54_9ACTN|nr:hypothetical protein [Kribbella italica]MBB5839974.1 hypothetical protein [Kribbella italica]